MDAAKAPGSARFFSFVMGIVEVFGAKIVLVVETSSGEHLPLNVGIFGDRFDDQIAVG